VNEPPQHAVVDFGDPASGDALAAIFDHVEAGQQKSRSLQIG
jgi:hypothetical protein